MTSIVSSKKADPKDKHGAPGGPEVEFYLGANPQYKKGEAIPINVNGHKHWVVVGQRNTLPQDALEVLQNAKSQTEVPKLDEYDPARRGVPRKQEDFYNPKTEFVYQSDYDIEILKVHD